ncbi:hypothetical protein HZC30_03480 [Candidatus Woesearchaeota archaeon]|nr:hypothetical protein [Candidatus Woesearchaeota archaeon]
MRKIFVVILLLVLIGLIFYINEYVYQEKCPAKILSQNISGEKEIYKGVYMPTLSASSLREDYRPYSFNLDKAAENGINTLAFGPMFYVNDKGEVWLVPETKEFLISFIKKAQSKDFRIWLIPEVMFPEPDLKQKFFHGVPGPIPNEILENTDFMQNLDSAVIEWAKIAEELKIDIFSPLNEADNKLGIEKRVSWLEEIKPKIEAVYSGKICLKGEWNTSAFNNSYSCFAPTIGTPENEEEKNKLAITINNLAEDAKNRNLELIIGEIWSGPGWKGREKSKKVYAMALEACKGKVDGVFILDTIGSRFFPAPAGFEDFKCVVREFYTQN